MKIILIGTVVLGLCSLCIELPGENPLVWLVCYQCSSVTAFTLPCVLLNNSDFSANQPIKEYNKLLYL